MPREASFCSIAPAMSGPQFSTMPIYRSALSDISPIAPVHASEHEQSLGNGAMIGDFPTLP